MDEVKIPEGWYRLGPEETIQEGDQLYNHNHFEAVSASVGEAVGTNARPSGFVWGGPWCVIRKIDKEKEASMAPSGVLIGKPRIVKHDDRYCHIECEETGLNSPIPFLTTWITAKKTNTRAQRRREILARLKIE